MLMQPMYMYIVLKGRQYSSYVAYVSDVTKKHL